MTNVQLDLACTGEGGGGGVGLFNFSTRSKKDLFGTGLLPSPDIHNFLSHYSTVIVLFIRISTKIKTLMFRERLEKAKTNLETKTKNVNV